MLAKKAHKRSTAQREHNSPEASHNKPLPRTFIPERYSTQPEVMPEVAAVVITAFEELHATATQCGVSGELASSSDYFHAMGEGC